MSPCKLPYGLTLGRFLLEDPILEAMHHHRYRWADILCDDVEQLCAPALKDVVALHASNDVADPSRNASPLFIEPEATRVAFPLFADPTPSRNASPLFIEPEATRVAFPLFADPTPSRNASPLFIEPVARMMASARGTCDSPMLTESVARLMDSARAARDYSMFTVPVAQMMVRAAVCSARTSLLFTEPIPAPVVEAKHAYFTTSTTIVPTEPSLFVSQALPVDGIKTIIVRNLPRAIAPEELRERFQLYGVVRDVYLPRNKDLNSPHYGTIRGFALIKYDTAAESARAIRILSTLGLSIRGKKVTVEFAKSDTATRT